MTRYRPVRDPPPARTAKVPESLRQRAILVERVHSLTALASEPDRPSTVSDSRWSFRVCLCRERLDGRNPIRPWPVIGLIDPSTGPRLAAGEDAPRVVTEAQSPGETTKERPKPPAVAAEGPRPLAHGWRTLSGQVLNLGGDRLRRSVNHAARGLGTVGWLWLQVGRDHGDVSGAMSCDGGRRVPGRG